MHHREELTYANLPPRWQLYVTTGMVKEQQLMRKHAAQMDALFA